MNIVNFCSFNPSSTISDKIYNLPTTNNNKTAEEVTKVLLGKQNIKQATINLNVREDSLYQYVGAARKVCIKGSNDISSFKQSLSLLQRICDKYCEITNKPTVKLTKSMQQSSKPNSKFSSTSEKSKSTANKKVKTYNDTLFTDVINKPNEKVSSEPDFNRKRKLKDPSENNGESNILEDNNFLFIADDSTSPCQISIPEEDAIGFYIHPEDSTINNEILVEPINEPIPLPPVSSSSLSSLSSEVTISDKNLFFMRNIPSSSTSQPAIVISSTLTSYKHSMEPTGTTVPLLNNLSQKSDFSASSTPNDSQRIPINLLNNPFYPLKRNEALKLTVSDLVNAYQQCKTKIQNITDTVQDYRGDRSPLYYPLLMIDALVQPSDHKDFLAKKYKFNERTFRRYKHSLNLQDEDKVSRVNKTIIKAARLIKTRLASQIP